MLKTTVLTCDTLFLDAIGFILFQDLMIICNNYFPEIYNLISHECE